MTAHLTTSELQQSTNILIRHVQQVQFEEDYKNLSKDKTVNAKRKILKLSPYMDQHRIIRVGGRLKYSKLPQNMKNSAILPHSGKLTQLVIDHGHHSTLHGGARLTLAYVRQSYWILGGNSVVRTALRRCVKCHRYNLREHNQLMGDLPPARVTPSRPFTQTGIDRTGNVDLKNEQETSTTQPDSPASITRKSGRGSTSSILNFLLVTIIIFCSQIASAQTTSNIQMINLEKERPIYYDPRGKISLMHDEWILVVYYNLSSYWNGTQQMEKYLHHLDDVCNKIDAIYCRTTLQQLYHEMDLLNYYNEILLEPSKHFSSRRKRGLIDGVGYIANGLFGILDQRFATKYENDISAIQENEHHLLSLIKNQTSIVLLENEALKKNEKNINKQFQAIESYLKTVNTSLNSVQTHLEATMAVTYFSSSSITASLLLNNLRRIQELLFNTLTDIYKGHVDIHLLSPENLINQLNIISGHLPRKLSLPVENINKDIKDVYKLLYVRGRITNGYFLFEIHIPLLCDELFEVFKIIPLPTQTQNNISKWVQISSEYIAVNFRKNTYMSMTQQNIDKCTQRTSSNIICHSTVPIHDLHHTKNTPCEAKLIGQQTSTSCEFTSRPCRDNWIKLQASNMWLAICCGECHFRTICEDKLLPHTLRQSSIITLASGCILQTENLLIYSHNSYNSSMMINPVIGLPIITTNLLNTSINAIISAKLRDDVIQHYSPDGRLDDIANKISIQQQSENTQLIKTTSNINIHDVIEYAILSAFALSLFAWLVRDRCRLRRPQERPPSAATVDTFELQSRDKSTTSNQPRKSHTTTGGLDNVSFNFE